MGTNKGKRFLCNRILSIQRQNRPHLIQKLSPPLVSQCSSYLASSKKVRDLNSRFHRSLCKHSQRATCGLEKSQHSKARATSKLRAQQRLESLRMRLEGSSPPRISTIRKGQPQALPSSLSQWATKIKCEDPCSSLTAASLAR